MIIRPATLLDRQDVRRLAIAFSYTPPYDQLFDEATRDALPIVDLLYDLIALDRAAIFLAIDAGGQVLGGLAICANINLMTGAAFADELCWYVEPAHRKGRVGPYLLGAGEKWALEKRLGSIKMVAPHPSTVGRFLERRGYVALETAYLKRL